MPQGFQHDRRARHDEKRHTIPATKGEDRAPDTARRDLAALTPPALRGLSLTPRGSVMNTITRTERQSDAAAIEALQHEAFGPGAYSRAAFRVREQAPHDPTLSFVTELEGALIGSVRMTPIRVGDAVGLLLGPLVVEPARKGQGFGKALMRFVMEETRKAGWPFVILVGDQPYYWPFGFRPLTPNSVVMPGPVDPARLLVAELVPGETEGLSGLVTGIAMKAALPAKRRRSAAAGG